MTDWIGLGYYRLAGRFRLKKIAETYRDARKITTPNMRPTPRISAATCPSNFSHARTVAVITSRP
jgi:hypothetical protein